MRLTKNGKLDRRSLGNNRGIRSGSTTDWLNSFAVNERRWFESGKDLGAAMRKAVPHKTRWPEDMRHKNFTCSAWTAVGKVGECRVLVCVQRIADVRAEDQI